MIRGSLALVLFRTPGCWLLRFENAVLVHRFGAPNFGAKMRQWAWDSSILLLGECGTACLEKRPAQKWPERFAPRRSCRQAQSDLAAVARAPAPPFCLNQGLPTQKGRELRGAATGRGVSPIYVSILGFGQDNRPLSQFLNHSEPGAGPSSRVRESIWCHPRAPLRHVLVNCS